MISEELRAEIKRLFEVEHWRVGTIAVQLGVHHSAVRRVIGKQARSNDSTPRRRLIDPYLPFIKETLATYPTLTAARLLGMVEARGYCGKESRFREIIAELRPRKAAEAFLRLRTLPGEQAQVDWGDFGRLQVGRANYVLSGFVMVLSYSRTIYLEFFLGKRHEHFLRGHEHAFDFFGGIARVLLYDNLKSVVIERRGQAIRFHPLLLEFAGHHRFQARPAAPYRGNEKGRVERAIQFIRKSFFAARTFEDLADLNRQALEWCRGTAMERKWVDDPTLTVRSALDAERPHLLPLPDDRFPTMERKEVVVGKTPYVRFDRNDYSVPHTVVRRSLLVEADLELVRVFDGKELVAVHRRSFDKRARIEDESHLAPLRRIKAEGRRERGKDRLAHAAPSTIDLLTLFVERRGGSISTATSMLLDLLDTFGAGALEAAAREAVLKSAPHPHAVRHILETRHRDRGLLPILPLELPDDARVRGATVRPADLNDYSFLTKGDEADEAEDGGAAPCPG